MQALAIEIANSPAEAPNYARDCLDIRAATITKVIIVGKGTEAGLPTVDFQFEALDGEKFVALLTGNLVKQIAHVVLGVESRSL